MTLLSKKVINIAIVNNSQGERCNARCGADWTSTQDVTLAGQRIKERFGENIKLEHFDMAKSTAKYPPVELQQQIKKGKLHLPLLVINDKAVISGEFDIRQLLDAIDAEMEIRDGK